MSIRSVRPSLLFLVLVLVSFAPVGPWSSGGARAQAVAGLTAYGGAALPTGPFAGSDSEDAGLATSGYAFGLDLGIPLARVPGLSVHSTLGAVTFGVEENVFDDTFGTGFDVDVGRYWGGLALSGLRYGGPAAPGLTLHATGQAGLVMFRAPDAVVSVAGQRAEMVSYWEPVLGACLGAGARLGGRVDLDARYFTLGRPSLEGQLRMSGLPNQDIEAEQPVAWLQLTLGLRVR